MTQDARKKLLEKIKALLAKTQANGCTEAEAMAALAKASELMEQYEISADDLQFGGEQVRKESRRTEDASNIRGYLAMAIGRFCDCRVTGDSVGGVTFYGLESDTIFAHWLLEALAAFVYRNLIQYLAQSRTSETPHVRRLEINGFVIGCTGRISKRLDELTHARRSATATGRGIVVAKNGLIEAFLKAEGILIGRGRRRPKKSSIDALMAGRAAGNRATFDRPVNGGPTVRQIGR